MQFIFWATRPLKTKKAITVILVVMPNLKIKRHPGGYVQLEVFCLNCTVFNIFNVKIFRRLFSTDYLVFHIVYYYIKLALTITVA